MKQTKTLHDGNKHR